jgi:hypothetical protein
MTATITSTEIVATNCLISLDNAANVLTDISGSLNSVEVALENGIAEFRPFSTKWKQRVVVGKDGTVTLRAIYSNLATEAVALLRNWFFGAADTARSLEIDIPDAAMGAIRIWGEFVLASLSIPLDAEADDVVRVEAELRPDGAINVATLST